MMIPCLWSLLFGFDALTGVGWKAPRVWQPKVPAKSDNLSFEDMMSRFKSQSEEKMADLDHETNNRRGGGYAPRSRRGR